MFRPARLGFLAALSVAMLPHTAFYAGKGGAAAKTDAKDHGVDEKHKNPAVTGDTPNHEGPKGDKPKVEPGKDTGEREERKGAIEQARDAEANPKKSIVPAKYAGKYKGGGSDPLAKLITEHSAHPESKEFDYPRFFKIARNNGVADEHVKTFEDAVASKALGAAGRARMTLRNRIDTLVRKNGHFVDHDGHKHELKLGDKVIERAAKPAAATEAKESVAA